MKTRRDVLQVLTGLCTYLAIGVNPAHAQSFPTKAVRITTPFSAGSGPDAALRTIAERLSKKWGKPVVIDNKPGGNGFIAVSAFRGGATDGHDLIQLDSNHITTHPHTFRNLPYEPARDFAPLRMILRTHFFVVVPKDSPFKSVDDIVNAARAAPGKVTYGSWFNGSPGHMGALLLESMKKIQMLHVPYRDFAQLYTAVSANEVQWALGSLASAGPMEQTGRVRFLALAGPTREPTYPKVPTTAELPSMRGYEVSGWTGIFAPIGTAPAVRERIAADIAEALASPDVVERYKALGYERPDFGTAAYAQLIQRETSAWAATIKNANLRLD